MDLSEKVTSQQESEEHGGLREADTWRQVMAQVQRPWGGARLVGAVCVGKAQESPDGHRAGCRGNEVV